MKHTIGERPARMPVSGRGAEKHLPSCRDAPVNKGPLTMLR